MAIPEKCIHAQSQAVHTSVTILLADDYPFWRLEAKSFLRRQTQWEIVCEANDGLEAVQKAAELRPNVALLDLNMPKMNGIEATREIHLLSPDTSIVILSLIDDEDVRAAALNAGAVEYVLKTEMTTALIPAVLSALETRV